MIDLGICGAHGAPILGFTSSSRLMKRLKMERREQLIKRANLPANDLKQLEEEEERERSKARFEAILSVSDAIQRGTI